MSRSPRNNKRWNKVYANPDYALSLAQLRPEEWRCGHVLPPGGDGSLPAVMNIENFRVALIPGWDLSPGQLRLLPCFFVYWLQEARMSPKRFLAVVWGEEATAEAFDPQVVIGRVDGGDLEAYLARCVRESCRARCCPACFTDTRLLLGTEVLVEGLKHLPGSGPQTFAHMKDVIGAAHLGHLRRTEAAELQIAQQIETAAVVAEWKRRLRTRPKTGLTGSAFAALLSGEGYDTDWLMGEGPAGVPELLSSQVIEERFFPLLKLLIQDNFLEARPALGEDLSYEQGEWREATQPQMEGRSEARAVLSCLYCRKRFVVQEDGNISLFTVHYIKRHWPQLQRRSQQIRTAQASALPQDTLPAHPRGD